MDDPIPPYLEEIEKLKAQKNYAQARKLIQESLIKYNSDYRLYEEMADVHLFEGDTSGARKAAEYANKLEPDSPTTLYLLGYIDLVNGQFEDSIQKLEKSNSLSPNNPEVLRNLGWSLTMTGEVKQGVGILERALNLSPDDALIMEDLGMALLTLGNTAEARAYLKKAGKEERLSEFGFPQ